MPEISMTKPALPTGCHHNHVDLWLWNLSAATPVFSESSFTLEEWERAQRYRASEKRLQYLATHWIGKHLLSRYLDCSSFDVSWSTAGPPVVKNFPDAPRISFSHSGHWGMLGISRRSLGVDLENCKAALRTTALARHCLTSQELQEFSQLDQTSRDLWLWRQWTRKESVLKALGSSVLPQPRSARISSMNCLSDFDRAFQPFEATLTDTCADFFPRRFHGRSFAVDLNGTLLRGFEVESGEGRSPVLVASITLGDRQPEDQNELSVWKHQHHPWIAAISAEFESVPWIRMMRTFRWEIGATPSASTARPPLKCDIAPRPDATSVG
jgi:4'-phosphopantetheinyl transferase